MDSISEGHSGGFRHGTGHPVHLDAGSLAEHAGGGSLTAAQEEHLSGCPSCQEQVDEWARVVEQVRTAATVELVDPPPHLWQLIADAVDAEDAGAAERPMEAPAARRPALLPVVAGALVGLLLGVAGVVGADRLTGSSDQEDQLKHAQLLTLDTADGRGTANLVRTGHGMALDITTAPLEAGSGYLEVWLLNTDSRRMVSVGILQEGASHAVFPVSQKMIDDGYLVVDISMEQLDRQPQHSGHSLLRGRLSS